MAFAIDRGGLNNEMRHQLQPKKTKVMLYYPFYMQQKAFYPPFITSKMERCLKHCRLYAGGAFYKLMVTSSS